ncbi:MAG: GTP cyclohydrolase I [Myxococcota bacterium]
MVPAKRRTRVAPTRNRRDVERAVRTMLESLGHHATGELRATPQRVATLWLDHLLAGERVDVDAVLAECPASASQAAVLVTHVAVHLVCPHHLTVAFGKAHLGYFPGGRLAGFGTLARLVQACTARLVLQEEATEHIADVLVNGLGARAAVVAIEAVHPCHNIPEPRSHGARASTWAQRGDDVLAATLQRKLEQALARERTPKGRHK